MNTRAAEHLREVVGVDREAPPNVFLLITSLSLASPICDAAQAVEVVDRIECAAEPAIGQHKLNMYGKSRSFIRYVISRRVIS